MRELKWALDTLTIKDGVLFGFGWMFHTESKINEAYIQPFFASQGQQASEQLAIDTLKPRSDVAAAYPDHVNALYSGFVFLGALPQAHDVASIRLVCRLSDGDTCSVMLPMPITQANRATEGASRRMWQQLSRGNIYIKRGFSLLRAGKWSLLMEKARRHLKAKPQGQLVRPSDLAQHFDASGASKISVIIDHDLGGGANHYRERHVDAWIAAGGTALVLTHHITSLTSVVIIKSQSGEKRLSVPNTQFFLEAVSRLPVAEVIYNTAVSLAHPAAIASLLVGIQHACGARLRVLVHDFYLVCPSHFLINHEGKFCNIPDVSQCATCLKRNSHGFVSLYPARDIVQWRGIWGAVLAAADEIVAFSNNSAQLLHKAYPKLALERVTVLPHSVRHLPARIPLISSTQQLHIGILGQIGFHKGAQVIAALAAHIKQLGVDVKITVIGAIEANCDKDVLKETGPYQHDDLPHLIERSNANIFLFPSICPETFSYVVQELMDMQLPVAAFNFGAPAERLAAYDKGLILHSMEPAALLSSLLTFHHTIYTKD